MTRLRTVSPLNARSIDGLIASTVSGVEYLVYVLANDGRIFAAVPTLGGLIGKSKRRRTIDIGDEFRQRVCDQAQHLFSLEDLIGFAGSFRYIADEAQITDDSTVIVSQWRADGLSREEFSLFGLVLNVIGLKLLSCCQVESIAALVLVVFMACCRAWP